MCYYLANSTVVIQHLAPACISPLTGSWLLNKLPFHGGAALLGASYTELKSAPHADVPGSGIIPFTHPFPWRSFQNPMALGRLPCQLQEASLTLISRKFTVHILLKSGLENFEHYFTSVWDECNCVVVWAFFGIAFLWDWDENWPFAVLWPLLSFPNLLAYWVQDFHSIILQDLKQLKWNSITSTSFVRSDVF